MDIIVMTLAALVGGVLLAAGATLGWMARDRVGTTLRELPMPLKEKPLDDPVALEVFTVADDDGPEAS